MDGYDPFSGDGKGRRGSGVALYVRKWFGCPEVNDGDKSVKCFWIRIRGRA